MPSPIRVPIYERAHSDTASWDEDGNDAITAYLTPLLTKHDRGQPLVYEDLLESYEVAKAVAASSANGMAKEEVENMHESQLLAYEACARTELAKLAEGRACAAIEEGESMPRYIDRCAQTVKDGDQAFRGWRVSNELMEEVFWSKVKAGARKAYFAFKSQSIEKDKERNAPDQAKGKVKAFEAAALGALVSESQDSDMADGENGRDEEGDKNEEDDDIGDDDEVEDDDGDYDPEKEEAEAESDDDDEDKADDLDVQDEGLSAVAEAEANSEDAPPVKTPMKTKKKRRLPNVPLGGGGTAGTTDGGKKPQPVKKQKTGKGANDDTTNGGSGRGSAGGRGKGASKSGNAGRGGGGGRGTRKRNRKKGTGAGAGGVA